MVLIRVFLTHEFSRFWIFEAVNGVLMEYEFQRAQRARYAGHKAYIASTIVNAEKITSRNVTASSQLRLCAS